MHFKDEINNIWHAFAKYSAKATWDCVFHCILQLQSGNVLIFNTISLYFIQCATGLSRLRLCTPNFKTVWLARDHKWQLNSTVFLIIIMLNNLYNDWILLSHEALIIIIIVSLFRLTNHNNSCHAGQHKLARRPEQQGLARGNAATNSAKQSRQPQPGRGLVGIHQMSPLSTHPINRPTTHLSTPEGWKAYSVLLCTLQFLA